MKIFSHIFVTAL